MQKGNSPHTAAKKHLSPMLSGIHSAAICQFKNNLLLICSRQHLFSWQAGLEQRQLKDTLVVQRAVSSAGNVKETQRLCPLEHGTIWLWWWQPTGLCPHDWLEEPCPGSRSLWPWPTPKEGGSHAQLGPGAAPRAWSCWWPHLQELCWGWGTKWPGTGAVGQDSFGRRVLLCPQMWICIASVAKEGELVPWEQFKVIKIIWAWNTH